MEPVLGKKVYKVVSEPVTLNVMNLVPDGQVFQSFFNELDCIDLRLCLGRNVVSHVHCLR